MAKIYKIDPNADTVITLKNPLRDFAVWNLPDEENLDAKDSVSQADLAAEENSKEGSVVEPSESNEDTQEPIQYHVSSSILRLASSYFQRMLSGRNWKESIPNEKDGRYHITVEEWDEEALLILLNALHLRSREVPRSLSLDMLAKIAMLIEYYNCAQAVELWSEMWIRDLEKPIPSQPTRELMLWIYIAWVFELPEEFTHTTAVAIGKSKGNQLSISDLPISRFVDKIAEARIKAISTIISKLHKLLEKYRSGSYKCPEASSFECGSIHYGALAKGMASLGLLSPYSEAPFSGFTVQQLCKHVLDMKTPMWYTVDYKAPLSYTNHPSCNMYGKLKKITEGIESSIKGLQLTDFARI